MPQFIELDNLKGNIDINKKETINQLKKSIKSKSNSPKEPDDTEIAFMLWLSNNTKGIKIIPNIFLQGNEIDFVIIYDKFSYLIEIKRYDGKEKTIEKVKKQVKKDVQMQLTKEIDIIGFAIIWEEKEGLKEIHKYYNDKFEQLSEEKFLKEINNEGKSLYDFKKLNELNKIKRFDAYNEKVENLLDSVEKNEFVLSIDQESVLNFIRNKIHSQKKILLDLPAGCGKTLILIKYIKELLDDNKKVIFISLNDKELKIKDDKFKIANIHNLNDNFLKSNSEAYYLTDEIQVMHKSTYDKLLKNCEKLIGLGDKRLQLKSEKKLIEESEYDKKKFKIRNYRNHTSICNFVNRLMEREDVNREIEEENRVSLYKVDSVPEEDLNEYTVIVNNKHDKRKAIQTLGLEYDTVNIFLDCTIQEYNYNPEDDFSIKKKLIVHSSRAIKRLNIYCTDNDVLNELDKINNRASILKNIKDDAYNIIDEIEKEEVLIDFKDETGFCYRNWFKIYIPNEIKIAISEIIDKDLKIKEFNHQLEKIFEKEKVSFYNVFNDKENLVEIKDCAEQQQYIDKIKETIIKKFENQFSFLEENNEK